MDVLPANSLFQVSSIGINRLREVVTRTGFVTGSCHITSGFGYRWVDLRLGYFQLLEARMPRTVGTLWGHFLQIRPTWSSNLISPSRQSRSRVPVLPRPSSSGRGARDAACRRQPLRSPLQSSRVFELPVARRLPIALSQCPRQRFALRFLWIVEQYLCGLDPADL